jgi:hypothetical protein
MRLSDCGAAAVCTWMSPMDQQLDGLVDRNCRTISTAGGRR